MICFEDNVDVEDNEKVKKEEAITSTTKRKAKVCKEENEEEEYLWGPDSDDDMGPMRFKTFRKVGLQDPKFHVGQTFESIQLLRKAIQAYSCKHNKDTKLPINDRRRLNARCRANCTWYLWASYSSITKCFMMEKNVDKHSCGSTFKVHAFTSNFLTVVAVYSRII
jgi:hypothetical protein